MNHDDLSFGAPDSPTTEEAAEVRPAVVAPADQPVATEGYIVVKEHAWYHGDGDRPTLAYLWPAEFNRQVFATADEATVFIQREDLPIGWVRMRIALPAAPVAPASPIAQAEPLPRPCGWVGANHSHEDDRLGYFEPDSPELGQPRKGWAPVFSEEQMRAAMAAPPAPAAEGLLVANVGRLQRAVAAQLQTYVDDPAFVDDDGEKTTLRNAIMLLTTPPVAPAEPQPLAVPEVKQHRIDAYDELADALGSDCMDSHAGRLDLARKARAEYDRRSAAAAPAVAPTDAQPLTDTEITAKAAAFNCYVGAKEVTIRGSADLIDFARSVLAGRDADIPIPVKFGPAAA